MGTTLLEPELERFPNRHRWTVEAANGLRDLGVLQGHFELLDGEIIDKMGQGPLHYFGISQFVLWANAAFGDRFVRVQGPIGLLQPDNIYSEPEPDVAITKEPPSAYMLVQPGPDDLHLVMEVADTSLPIDLVIKARLYARAGIAEYWVLDLKDRLLHVHLHPKDGFYSKITTHSELKSVSPTIRPDALLAVKDLLSPVD